jgi:hypothetical protein
MLLWIRFKPNGYTKYGFAETSDSVIRAQAIYHSNLMPLKSLASANAAPAAKPPINVV